MTGKDFQKKRQTLKLSQRGLGLILGVTDKTISTWERSKKVSRLVCFAVVLLELAEIVPAAETALKGALGIETASKKVKLPGRRATPLE